MSNYDLATLSTASYATAQTTGALSFMDYSEVKRYAGEFDVVKRQLRVAAGELLFTQGYADVLLRAYDRALKE